MSAVLKYEPEPELTGRELGVLLVADTPNLRIERGEFRREIPRLVSLGLGYFGINNPDRFFLTDRGREIARAYR